MKRNKFIAGLLSLSFMPAMSFATPGKVQERKTKGFKVKAGEGRLHGHIQLKGVNANILDIKISGTDTDGDLAIFEQTSLSPGRGTPLHIHPHQDEVFYVLEGSYRFRVGEDLFSLSAGESIFLPRTVPHAWTQISEKGKMTVIFQPAGKMENFFISVASLNHEPTLAEIQSLFAANDMQVVGPPLAP